MHPRIGEALVRGVRGVGVIDNTGNDDRWAAVFEQVNPFGKTPVAAQSRPEQILHSPYHAMAFRLTRDDHGIERP